MSAISKKKENMKKSSALITVMFLLCALTACTGNTSTPNPTSEADNIATIVAATLSAIPSATIAPTSTDTPVIDEWTWHNIDLYSLKLKLPSGWTISEINRRPEPTIPAPITGHDCADYTISNLEGTIQLSLFPICGIAGGVGDSCPGDSAVIDKQSDTGMIIRYFNQDKSAYIYTYAGLATISDTQGTRSEILCYNPPILSFGEGQNLRFIQTEFRFLGTAADLDQVLVTIDEIVLSIGEQ
jgi:hypothetical protein